MEGPPPVLRFAVDDLNNLPLAYDGIAFLADAGVAEKLHDVLQAAALLVDEVFAFTGAEDPSGNGDFGIGDGQQAFAVVDSQVDLAKGKRLALGSAVKYDVFHPRATKHAGILLTQHPAHGIADVALAATVGPDDGGNALVKMDLYLVGKRFEAEYFKFFEAQVLTRFRH